MTRHISKKDKHMPTSKINLKKINFCLIYDTMEPILTRYIYKKIVRKMFKIFVENFPFCMKSTYKILLLTLDTKKKTN